MPSPSSTAFIRPDLMDSFHEFDLMASMQGFIGPQVLPFFPTQLQAGQFSLLPVEALLAERNTRRASGAHYARQPWEFEQASFATQEYGAEELLDDRERAMYAYAFDFEQINAMRAMDAVLRAYEKRVADATFNASTFTTTAVGTEWDIPSSATPVDDVLTEITAFKNAAGVLPNAVIMNDKVLRNLQRNDQIIDRLKYSGIDDPKKVTTQALAALWGVERVIVPNAMRNSANPGQTVSFSDIWDDEYVAVARLCMSQDLREPGFGRTFHWVGDGSSVGGTVEMYRDESRRSNVVRVRIDVQEKVLYTRMLRLLSNITQ